MALAAPAPDEREPLLRPSIYVRIGTRMEIAPRQELPWVRQATVATAPFDAPLDREGIVLEL
jgi:hypothetical protein